jgi:hypothetical protein
MTSVGSQRHKKKKPPISVTSNNITSTCVWSCLALDGAKHEPALKSDSNTRLETILSTHYKLSFEQCSAANTLDADTPTSFSATFALGEEATLSAAQSVGESQSFAGRCRIEL